MRNVFAALVLLAIALFCGVGFLATFEPPGSVGLRIVYGVIGLACFLGAAMLLRKLRTGSTQ